MRLGLFLDAAFRVDEEGRVRCGAELLGFASFAAAVGSRLGGLALIARRDEGAAATPFPLPAGVEHLPLPHYPSLRRIGAMAAATPATVRALWRALAAVDLVWISVGSPIGLLVVALARLRGKPFVLLVRQDTIAYYRNRLPGRAWAPLLAPLWLLDRAFRRLGRHHPTTAVGAAIATAYGAPRRDLLEFDVNLVAAAAIPSTVPQRRWESPIRLLTVGRIEPEKAPLLLAEALLLLESDEPGRYRATWAGEGRLRGALAAHAERLGVAALLDLPGFVPFGDPLRRLYREADACLHVALTEGVPGVVWEAMASGLPLVATDVGGVRAATGDGAAALLVPPGDAAALAAAVRRLAGDPGLREEIVAAGLARARASSLEEQGERVAGFLRQAAGAAR